MTQAQQVGYAAAATPTCKLGSDTATTSWSFGCYSPSCELVEPMGMGTSQLLKLAVCGRFCFSQMTAVHGTRVPETMDSLRLFGAMVAR